MADSNFQSLVRNLIENLSCEDATVTLFFITREIKSDVKKSQKVLDKYNFNAIRAKIDTDLNNVFVKFLIEKIKKETDSYDREVIKFALFDDDADNKIYSYSTQNKIHAFLQVFEQMKKSVDKKLLENLKDIQDSLWAFCWNVKSEEHSFYLFCKASKVKVITDKPDKNFFRAIFGTKDKELSCFDDKQIVTFNRKIDCLWVDGQFFVFNKRSFEDLVVLNEEMQKLGKEAIKQIRTAGLILGIEDLEEDILNSPRRLRVLAAAYKNNNINALDSKEKLEQIIETQQQIPGKSPKLQLDSEGRIKISTIKEYEELIRIVNDYYKIGTFTNTMYGTNSGRKIEET